MQPDQTMHLRSFLNQLLGAQNVNVRSDLNQSHFHQQNSRLLSFVHNHHLLLLLDHAGQQSASELAAAPGLQATSPASISGNIDSANQLSTFQLLCRLQSLGQPTRSTLPNLFTHKLAATDVLCRNLS
jgi:hypothetical protein